MRAEHREWGVGRRVHLCCSLIHFYSGISAADLLDASSLVAPPARHVALCLPKNISRRYVALCTDRRSSFDVSPYSLSSASLSRALCGALLISEEEHDYCNATIELWAFADSIETRPSLGVAADGSLGIDRHRKHWCAMTRWATSSTTSGGESRLGARIRTLRIRASNSVADSVLSSLAKHRTTH